MMLNQQDIKEGKILLVDKPIGVTSFHVVKEVRYHIKKHFCFKTKLKVGHAGTLDPKATGLLILCIGKKTKEIHHFQDLTKVYQGQFKLGEVTASYDRETPVIKEFDISNISEKDILNIAESMTGEIEQTPPQFSAKKIKGKRAHEHARSGETIEMKKNNVQIYRFDINKVELPFVNFTVKCSKGTYIRSLVHELGNKLNNGATLTELRRIAIGSYTIEQALTLDKFIENIKKENSDKIYSFFLE